MCLCVVFQQWDVCLRDINYKTTSFDVNDTHVDGQNYMTGYYFLLQSEKRERVICKVIV